MGVGGGGGGFLGISEVVNWGCLGAGTRGIFTQFDEILLSGIGGVGGGKVRERVRRHWYSALYPTMLLVATVDACVHKTLPLDAVVPTRLDP